MNPRVPPPATLRGRLAGRLATSAAEQTPIALLMSRSVTCVPADLPLVEAAAMFVAQHISALPVVDYELFPVGILSKSDLVRGHGPGRGGLALETGSLAGGTVTELMTPALRTLSLGASVADAARLMADNGLHHALVLDEEGRVAGIVSTFDFARWLAGR